MVLVQKLKVGLCYSLLGAVGGDVVLESTSTFPVGTVVLPLTLLVFERCVVHSSQIVVLEFHML